MDHLIKRWCDEAAQPDQAGPLLTRRLKNSLTRDHHAEVNYLIVVTAKHNPDDVLSDVVNVTSHGGEQYSSLRATGPGLLLCLHIGQEVSDGLLHDTGTLDYLREKHLAGSKEIAHDVHPVHERAFDHA